MEGVFRFKSWFLNAPGLIHGGVYYRNFTIFLSYNFVFSLAEFGVNTCFLRSKTLKICLATLKKLLVLLKPGFHIIAGIAGIAGISEN